VKVEDVGGANCAKPRDCRLAGVFGWVQVCPLLPIPAPVSSSLAAERSHAPCIRQAPTAGPTAASSNLVGCCGCAGDALPTSPSLHACPPGPRIPVARPPEPRIPIDVSVLSPALQNPGSQSTSLSCLRRPPRVLLNAKPACPRRKNRGRTATSHWCPHKQEKRHRRLAVSCAALAHASRPGGRKRQRTHTTQDTDEWGPLS
jgi:hypothetical protein